MERTTVSNIHVGCSGWVYKHWRGLLYPDGLPQRLWFDRYAQEFDTVEINNSFYRLPKAETFDAWRKQQLTLAAAPGAPGQTSVQVAARLVAAELKQLVRPRAIIDRRNASGSFPSSLAISSRKLSIANALGPTPTPRSVDSRA